VHRIVTAEALKPSKNLVLVGRVCSVKMKKTINVVVNRYVKVPKLNIIVRRSRKFMAHDESECAFDWIRACALRTHGFSGLTRSARPDEIADLNDIVKIRHGKSRTKNKAFELLEVLKRAPK
jgi:ribosomal protein S17